MFIYGTDTPFHEISTNEHLLDSDDVTEADNSDAASGFWFIYGMDIPLEDVE